MSKSPILGSVVLALLVSGCAANSSSHDGTGGSGSGAVGGTGGSTPGNSGGGSSTGGGAQGGNSPTGGAIASSGGSSSTGGSSTSSVGGASTGGAKSTGGTTAGGNPATGGRTGTGGTQATTGGSSANVGGGATGGRTGTGGVGAAATGGAATGGIAGTGGSSACQLPPNQCGNWDYVQGCIQGDASTPCGGVCDSYVNVCQKKPSTNGNQQYGFACPQWMLFSDAMQQAVKADNNIGLNYAVAGHDVDYNGIDGSASSSCCQCYQLVYDYPSSQDRQAWANPDDPNNTASGITPVPPPLVVQSFNTGATTDSFDIFMAAGGFGGNNGCDPNAGVPDVSGQYFYTAFPADGAQNGGVKGATKYNECKTSLNWVTTESLSTQACQDKVATACNQITAASASITAQSRYSCIQSNKPDTYYHLNWYVYAMKVECPSHLTDVTGCKLAPQGLPAVDPTVTTAAQAAANSKFRKLSGSGTRLWTTTMQDCCMPSCSVQNWVSGKGLVPSGQFNSFYTCDANGNPLTQGTCN